VLLLISKIPTRLSLLLDVVRGQESTTAASPRSRLKPVKKKHGMEQEMKQLYAVRCGGRLVVSLCHQEKDSSRRRIRGRPKVDWQVKFLTKRMDSCLFYGFLVISTLPERQKQ